MSVYYATEYLSRAVPASVHLVKYEGNILPANTGFVLRADEGNNADTLHFAFSADSASLPEGNILHGTVNGIDNADLSFSDYTYMVLGSNSLGNGFRALGTQEQIPACSAWLQLPVDAEKPSATPDFAVFDFNYETTYLDIKIGDNRVASVCLPHNAEVPAGTTVYYATEYIAQVNPNAVHLQKYEGSVLPANTGLVVFANDDNDADTLRFAYTDADASQPEGNILSGTVSGMSGTDLSFSDFTYMTVGCTDLGNGFCALASGDSIPAYSAYLQLPLDAENPSAAPQFAVFDFNYETSLRGVSAPDANGASAWFSIGGMRQSGAQRGVNIVKKADGTVKKVLVK